MCIRDRADAKTGGLLLGGAGVSGIEVLPPPPPQPTRAKTKKVEVKRKNIRRPLKKPIQRALRIGCPNALLQQ